MLRSDRRHHVWVPRARAAAAAALIAAAVSLAGCSADISRFGSSGLTLNGDDTRTGALPVPSEPVRRNAGIPVDTETPPAREPAARQSGLPDPAAHPEPLPPPAAKARPVPQGAAAAPRVPAAPPAGRQVPTITATPGDTIEVQAGDTLYGISKRHRVSISELMTLNNLQSPSIRPGQKIVLPAGRRAVAARPAAVPAVPAAAPVAPPLAGPVPPRAAAPAAIQPPPAAAAVDWTGSYTVAAGDSLYAIARRHGIKAGDLQTINGITDPTKIRPGTVLKVPAGSGPAAQAPAQPSLPTAAPTPPGTRPTIINAPPAAPTERQRVAALSPGAAPPLSPPAAAPSDPPKASGASRFRWPAKGKVIAGFGPRSDSTHNDGINISVPHGTEVLAAENGIVAYAGSELKGYGNLVLIRHENNWVSAYAHNDQLLVKRGDKVKRGQAIAKAGNSGAVDQPQVHFELRQGSKPVDPLPHMEAN
jgi:murein DD-endopeptidase MepM/ murein hydrolase activator NlpD